MTASGGIPLESFFGKLVVTLGQFMNTGFVLEKSAFICNNTYGTPYAKFVNVPVPMPNRFTSTPNF